LDEFPDDNCSIDGRSRGSGDLGLRGVHLVGNDKEFHQLDGPKLVEQIDTDCPITVHEAGGQHANGAPQNAANTGESSAHRKGKNRPAKFIAEAEAASKELKARLNRIRWEKPLQIVV
jgi:hypothetical protein